MSHLAPTRETDPGAADDAALAAYPDPGEEAAAVFDLIARGAETLASARALISVPPSSAAWLRTRSDIPCVEEAIAYRLLVLGAFDKLAAMSPKARAMSRSWTQERRMAVSEKMRRRTLDPAWRSAHSRKIKDYHARRRNAASLASAPAEPGDSAPTDATHLSAQTAA